MPAGRAEWIRKERNEATRAGDRPPAAEAAKGPRRRVRRMVPTTTAAPVRLLEAGRPERSTSQRRRTKMPVSAIIEDNEAEFEEADPHVTLALCDLLEEAGTGRMTLIELARGLGELTATAPEHIDARAHLGSVLMKCERLQEAAAEYERAFEMGSRALPGDFDGRIEGIRLDNRPFLRAAYGLALVRLKTGKRPAAIRLMERVLQWNPNDNQGIRLIIGSEYLRAGNRARAGKVLREHADEYPPYRYELGLLHLQKQQWAEAATSLRHGFVDNPYIAEILCGNPAPMPLRIREGTNWQGAETAREYVGEYGELWRRTADALEFLRWLHTHPRVMAERAAVIECRQELLWENDFHARGRILDRERAVRSGIESTLSREIIKPRTDRSGEPMAPWKDPRPREWPAVH